MDANTLRYRGIMGSTRLTDRELFLSSRVNTGIVVYSRLIGNDLTIELVFPSDDSETIAVSWNTWVRMLDIARTPEVVEPENTSFWKRLTNKLIGG